MEYLISMQYDTEANVWVATSEDIPGLVLESGSFDALVERVRIAAPELLALNHRPHPVSLKYEASFRQVVYA